MASIGNEQWPPGADGSPPHILTGLVILNLCSDEETRLVINTVGDE